MVEKKGMTKKQGDHKRPANQPQDIREDIFTATRPDVIARAILANLYHVQGRLQQFATRNDWYMALAYTVRDRMLNRWVKSTDLFTKNTKEVRFVSYLSAEFLVGPHLGNNLINLGLYDQVRLAVTQLGLNLDDLLEQEEEPGLGNGGLGRLAACFMDSLSTLQIPAIGYGIRYEFKFSTKLSRTGGRSR